MENMNLAALILSSVLSSLAIADQPGEREATKEERPTQSQSAEVGTQRIGGEHETTDERVRQLMNQQREESDDQRLEINP